MQTTCGLALIVGRLSAQPKHVLDTGLPQLGIEVAIAACLRCATAGARDLVPVLNQRRLARSTGAWVAKQHKGARETAQIDLCAVCRDQLYFRQSAVPQMLGASIIDRNR